MEELGEPPSEANRRDKLCAECQAEPATSFCGRCRCTPYCSSACAKAHWARVHKGACAPNSPWHLAPPRQLLPTSLREYGDAEVRAEHFWFLLRPGSLAEPPLDERDGACQLIEPLPFCPFGDASPWRAPPEAAPVDAGSDVGPPPAPLWDSTERQPAPVTAEACARLGWSRGRVVACPALGYGREDAALLVVLHDESLLEEEPGPGSSGAGPLEEAAGGSAGSAADAQPHAFRRLRNNVASSFAHLHAHRGAFLVGKVRRTLRPTAGAATGVGAPAAEAPLPAGRGGAGALAVVEAPVRMAKAELVDIAVWRRHLGSTGARHPASAGSSAGAPPAAGAGDPPAPLAPSAPAAVAFNIGHSTRMHRENMRRRELAHVLRSTGFQNVFL